MRNIRVEALSGLPVGDRQVEMVERKGIGHPDSICDAIMDRVSVELSREYLSQFGRILHHNIDKAFLVAGEAEVRFGGGAIREPMKLIFGDRASQGVNGREIPIREIAVRTAKHWLRENLRFVDPGDADTLDGLARLTDEHVHDRAPANRERSRRHRQGVADARRDESALDERRRRGRVVGRIVLVLPARDNGGIRDRSRVAGSHDDHDAHQLVEGHCSDVADDRICS